MDFSYDDDILVSASKDGTARVWDIRGRAIKHRLRGHQDWVRCAVVSPDGELVASASDDRSVRLWDISRLPLAEDDDNDSDVTEHRLFAGRNGHRDYVYAVTFSPTGKYLASSGDDLQILIWNLNSNNGDQEKPETTIDFASEESIRDLAFAADEKRILSCEVGGVVRILNIKTQTCEQVIAPEKQLQLFRSLQFIEGNPSMLMTEIGAWPILIKTPPTSKSDIMISPVKGTLTRKTLPEGYQYSISNNREWIMWDNKNLIFLPTQYRPSRTDEVPCSVQDCKVVNQGKYYILNF